MKVNIFKRKTNLQLSLSFYSSVLYVPEAILISEQITKHRTGALLEISDKISSKLPVFSCMILSIRQTFLKLS